MRHLFLKNDFQLAYCFLPYVHECSAKIIGHFLPIFDGFLSKLSEIAKFSLKIVIFLVIFNASLPIWCKILSGGTTFIFRPIWADFHEYTLNMTCIVHVTGEIENNQR